MAEVSAEDKALLERLRALEAETAALDAKAGEVSLAEKVARAERELREKKALAEAKAQHKRLAVLETRDNGIIILKAPNHVLYRRFHDKGDFGGTAQDSFVRPHLVYPDKVTFDRILEEEPATLDRATIKLNELAGHKREELTGKS